jgi:hypothetical protein
MKKIILFVCFVFIFSLSVSAQIFENGTTSDLKNLKKVYIASEVDTAEYKQIKAEIEKAKIPGLQIVGNAETADFSLIYANEKSEPSAEKSPVPFGVGMVAMNSSDGTKIRILMRYQSKFGERNAATKFARKVVAQYKAANKLK